MSSFSSLFSPISHSSPFFFFFYCFTPITSHRLNYRPSSPTWQAETIPKIKTFLTEIVRGNKRRGRESGRAERKRKGKRSWHIQCLFYFLFFFFSFCSRTECGDLTLSIRPPDKFNHGVPSAKSWLNRNANNRALGPLINGNQED